MRKAFKLLAVPLSIAFVGHGEVHAQTPTPPAEAPFVQAVADGRIRREQALAKLFEGQRYMWKLQRMQSQAGRANARKLAEAAFEASVTLDPTLAEGHTALSQLAVVISPRDIEEGIRQAELAVKADRENIGGHRMLARLYTAKSRLNNGTLDLPMAARAEAEWREVARLDPRNAEAWAFVAAFCEARGKPDEEIEALRKWVSGASPSDVGFYEGTMGGASLSPDTASLKLATALVKAGKFTDAASLLGELIADDPENTGAISLLSEVADQIEGEPMNGVVVGLQQAVYANPTNVSLADTLARLLVRSKRSGEAETFLKRQIASVVKIDQRAAATMAVSLAGVYLDADKYEESVGALESALTIRGINSAAALKEGDREFVQLVFEKLIHIGKLTDRPQTVRANIERARKLLGKIDLFPDRQMVAFLRNQGSLREALALVRSIREARPVDVGLLRQEATLLVDLGQVEAGVGLIRNSGNARATGAGNVGAAVTAAPDEFSDLLFIANLYSTARKGSEAVDSANLALSKAVGSERRQIAMTTLATAQEVSGKSVEAEKTLREVLAENPRNPMALNNLGYFLTERGVNLDEAVEMIRQALKIDPKNSWYLDSLGWAYFKQGRLSEAESLLAEAARIDTDSGTIREHLGDLYHARKDPEKAKANWEVALRLSVAAEDISRIRKKLMK